MKKSYSIYGALIIAAGIAIFASCQKSFLEQTPQGEFEATDYYANTAQALTGLVAAYDPLVTETGGLDNTYSDPLGALNSASDDCVAGGGSSSDESTWQAVNDYTQLSGAKGPQGEFWGINFTGVNRCNVLLPKLPTVPGIAASDLKRYTAETKFLRAHYYFDLVRTFKNVPLILTNIPLDSAFSPSQADPALVYAQVESDLNAAIPDLPVTVTASENGRATQGAGHALLGKVYLYEQKWAQAATELALVNGPTPGSMNPTYGYQLMANYGDIFSPDHKFNTESIFELVHTGGQSYTWSNWDQFKSNVYVNMVGPRSYTGPIYWSGGYGFNPISTQLVAAMQGDPRYGYTIVNIDSLTKATGSTYSPSYENSGYFIQKYAPLAKYKTSSGTAELNFPNDYIEIRLADTYLMEAEALVNSGGNVARAQALLDAVRARVGLPSVGVSLPAIYNERRLELATEGHRWYDLIRTGQAPTVLAYKGFKMGVNEILPIPLVELSNTNLKQNPGYN